jgi:hypothetical protein
VARRLRGVGPRSDRDFVPRIVSNQFGGQPDALVADVDVVGAGHDLPDFLARLLAERAVDGLVSHERMVSVGRGSAAAMSGRSRPLLLVDSGQEVHDRHGERRIEDGGEMIARDHGHLGAGNALGQLVGRARKSVICTRDHQRG